MSRHANFRLWSLAISVAGFALAGAVTLQSVTAETILPASPQHQDADNSLTASLQSYVAEIDGSAAGTPAVSAVSAQGLLAVANATVPNDSVHGAAMANLRDYLSDVVAGDKARSGRAGKSQLAQADTTDPLLAPDAGAAAPADAAGAAPAAEAAGQKQDCAGAAPAGGDLLAGGSATDCPPAASGGDDLLNAGGGSSGGGDDLLNAGGGSGGGDDLLAPAASGGDDLLAPSGGGSAGSDDLLTPAEGTGETAEGPKKEEAPPAKTADNGDAEHEKIFLESKYPSANTCATCHPTQYEQWSVSQHAYAQLSPVFMAMQAAINIKTSATNGDFCIRCHTPIGMNINESVYISNLKRNPSVARGNHLRRLSPGQQGLRQDQRTFRA